MRIMPSGKVGRRTGHHGRGHLQPARLRHEVRPLPARSSPSDLDETADLAVLYAGEALYVDQYVAVRVLRIVAHIGGRLPLHCTANGKALLAALTPDAGGGRAAGDAASATRPTR